MKLKQKKGFWLGLALLITSVAVGVKALAVTYPPPNPDSITESFKTGDPGTITVKIGNQSFDFTNSGVTYELLKNNRPSIQFTYGYSGTALCKPSTAPPSSLPSSSELRVTFSYNNLPKIDASSYSLIYSGNTSTSCSIPTFGGTFGFNKSLTYSPTVPPSGQGSEFTDSKFAGAKFTFLDGATIEASLPTNNGGPKTVDFKDRDPVDWTREFVSGTDVFCNNNEGKLKFNSGNQGDDPVPLNNEFSLWFYSSAGICSSTDTSLKFSASNLNKIATKVLKWGSVDQIDSVGTVVHNFSPQTTVSGPSKKVYVTNQNSCSGYGVELAIDNSGTLYQLNGDGTSNGPFSKCDVQSRDVLIVGTRPPPGTTACRNGADNPPDCTHCPDGSTPAAGAQCPVGGATDKACYTWELSWAVCPVIDAAQRTANTMYGFVEDQLHFTVRQNDSTDDSLGASHGSVHDAWNNFRILVSGLVVILMLIMVISQAIGTGPFDAYTIKKMLPRLVMGVILIQISWPVFAFVINVVNRLGIGLADLMYAPFGGADKMNLLALLGPFGPEAITFNWVGLVALGVFGVVAPFVVLGLILAVLAAVFAGFLTLLFRKILIILALILVPVALISWMMPSDGLRIYWKKWWENFSKALMMFPLIIAVIAAGRIFAKIGSAGHDFVGFFIVLVGFFGPLFLLPKTFKWGGTIMQSAGQSISDARTKASAKPKEYLKKQQEGYSALRDARSSNRYNNPDLYRGWNRMKFWQKPIDTFKAGKLNPLLGLPGSELRARQRLAFVARGNEYDTKQREEGSVLAQKIEDRMQENAVVDGVQGGNKDDMYQDMLRIAQGKAAMKRYFDTNNQEMDLKKLMGIGRFTGSRSGEIMNRAALDRMAELDGGTNLAHIEAEHERVMASGSAQERTRWRKYLNDNKAIFLEKMPDLLKGVDQVSDISAEGLSQMHGQGIARVIAKLDARANNPALTTAQRQEAQRRLTKFMNTYTEVLETPTLRGRLEQNGRRAVLAYATRDNATRRYLLYEEPHQIHSNPEDGREVIRSEITPDGHYDYTAQPNPVLTSLIRTNYATGAPIATPGFDASGNPIGAAGIDGLDVWAPATVHPVTGLPIPALRDRIMRSIDRDGDLTI